jgi:hypothetical protein
MSLVYSSSGDKLSDTDPINNTVLISGLDFLRDGAGLLSPGGYPAFAIGSYVHESLHHHCFRSPVGSAISLLYHRGFLRAYDYLSLGARSPFDDYDVLEDIVRVETILHLMRPLAEGIALFGEFDALPGKSKSLSATFRNVGLCFGKTVPNWERCVLSELIPEILIRARLQPGMIRRKENLLMQGFSTRNGGYLPGYFLVKNLQLALFRQTGSELVLDSEFYLNFLLHWFYGDFGLLETLLSSSIEMSSFSEQSVKTKDSMNALFVAFQRRVSGLFTVTAEHISKFDEAVANANVPWWKVQIGRPEEVAIRDEANLNAQIVDLVDPRSDLNSDQRGLRQLCLESFHRRNYMCLGSFQEHIEILSNGSVRVYQKQSGRELPIIAFAGSEKSGPYSGPCTIDILQSGLSEKVFLVISASGERVLIYSGASDFDEEREQLSGLDISTSGCREAKSFMRKAIEQCLESDGGAAMLRDYYRRESAVGADMIYRNYCGALMSLLGPEADIPSTPAALLEMCDGDTGFLRTLANLGCSFPQVFQTGDIASACLRSGMTAEQFLARAREVERRHNLRLIHQVGDYMSLSI